jgi:D-glycero-D-manno-heptose 1,7-bisphosphate phosphatase
MIEKYYFSSIDINIKKLVIFDRDDTLIRDVPNLKSASDIEWLPGRLELLRTLMGQSVLIAIATNQSGIGRGYLSIDEFNAISEVLRLQLEENGIKLWAIAACPHLPLEGCNCRKPMPGLLNRLVEATGLNYLEVLFAGNADTDIKAASASSYEILGVKLDPYSSHNFELITNLQPRDEHMA